MTTYHRDYGITASITDKPDGTATLTVKDLSGKKIHNKNHANRKAAYAAWARLCR